MLDADVVIRGEKGAFDLKAWLPSRPNGGSKLPRLRWRSSGTVWNAQPELLDCVVNTTFGRF